MGSRARSRFSVFCLLVLGVTGCSTFSEPTPKRYTFPKADAQFGKPTRPHEVLGVVRTKVNFPTLSSVYEESFLCSNYFNKAVNDLVQMAKDKGADAVVEVKAVTFLMDGTMETFEEAQCFDDGAEGQVLARGLAVKWVPEAATDKDTDKRTDKL